MSAPDWHEDGYIAGWIECWNCGGEGEIKDEDWQFGGEYHECDICRGEGGWKKPEEIKE